MHVRTNPYAGAVPRKGGLARCRQTTLQLGLPTTGDRRSMLVPWFERDLSAWETRTGCRATIRTSGDGSRIEWRVDGMRIASTDLSDLVYGRTDIGTVTNGTIRFRPVDPQTDMQACPATS